MNPNIGEAPKPSAVTEIGKFKRNLNLNKYKGKDIPDELIDLYDWYRCLSKREVDYLLELKNIYQVVKGGMFKVLLEKAESGKGLNRTELDQLRLAVDILEKSHKLKYGDKKVIERVVNIDDIRRQMFSDKKIVKAEVLQDDNRGDN
jgi:hypothetical protein